MGMYRAESRRSFRAAALLAACLVSGCDTGAEQAAPENEQGAAEQEIRLRAAIHGPDEIRFTLDGAELPAISGDYRLTDGGGLEIPIAKLLLDSNGAPRVVPGVALDPLRVHYLEIPAMELRTVVSKAKASPVTWRSVQKTSWS